MGVGCIIIVVVVVAVSLAGAARAAGTPLRTPDRAPGHVPGARLSLRRALLSGAAFALAIRPPNGRLSAPNNAGREQIRSRSTLIRHLLNLAPHSCPPTVGSDVISLLPQLPTLERPESGRQHQHSENRRRSTSGPLHIDLANWETTQSLPQYAQTARTQHPEERKKHSGNNQIVNR